MIAQATVSRSLIRDYVALTKPRIIVLLLVTAAGGMFLAARGAPDLSIMLLVFGAGTLASGGANAINQALERDIDGRMRRTLDRPVASGRIQYRQALLFGTSLNAISFMMLSTLVNPLSAVLTLSATLLSSRRRSNSDATGSRA